MVMGSEGRMEQTLSTDQDNAIVRVNLIEKILATVLAKISNFIPDEIVPTNRSNLFRFEAATGK